MTNPSNIFNSNRIEALRNIAPTAYAAVSHMIANTAPEATGAMKMQRAALLYEVYFSQADHESTISGIEIAQIYGGHHSAISTHATILERDGYLKKIRRPSPGTRNGVLGFVPIFPPVPQVSVDEGTEDK